MPLAKECRSGWAGSAVTASSQASSRLPWRPVRILANSVTWPARPARSGQCAVMAARAAAPAGAGAGRGVGAGGGGAGGGGGGGAGEGPGGARGGFGGGGGPGQGGEPEH